MISIEWGNIKRDVDKQTYRLAKIHIDDEHADVRDNMQEDDTASSVRFIKRFAMEGVALVRTAIKDAIVNSSELPKIDVLTEDNPIWQLQMSAGDEGVIATLVHKAIVDYILGRWCTTWLPNFAQQYIAAYADSLLNLQKACFNIDWCVKNKREKPVQESNNIKVEFE